ncbi:uncharacterized protein isoform X2 [Rhodnius prolixus]|uniref:uncharacterized protein isoform X2 n=1 Tax=Rhodnius prolixus TaxID=13249 RepID=UPI003D18AB30
MTDLKKSSDEIITELFDSINTVNASESDSAESEDKSKKSSKKERKKTKKSAKYKSSKKTKHEDDSKSRRHKKKKKRKKHKRKIHTSESDIEGVGKRKKLKRKSSKHKVKNLPEEICAVRHEDDKNKSVPENNVLNVVTNNHSDTSLIPLPPSENTNLKSSIPKPNANRNSSSKLEEVNVNCLKVADVFVEDLIESGDQKTVKSLILPPDKPKMAIKISDLRNSTVLELAEEQAKLQADIHEDGEIIESSRSSFDVSPFRNKSQDVGLDSSKNRHISDLLEKVNPASSHLESKFQLSLSEHRTIEEIGSSKEKRSRDKCYEKVNQKSRERDKPRDNSPQNSKLKKRSLERYSLDDSKEKKRYERERSRDRRRSREKKTGRSRSREKRSRSGSKSRTRYRSRSKEKKISGSKERRRSKSRERNKLKDLEKNKESKINKDKKLLDYGENSKESDQVKYKYQTDSVKKSDNVLTDSTKSNRRSKSKESKRERSRSKEPQKSRREKKTPERRGRSREGHSKRSRSSRSRSRSKHKGEYFIDKSKLLEIARKNALNMIKQGHVNIGVSSGISGGVGVGGSADVNKVAAITAGGKTVDELTDFCKLLSQKEATGQESVSSESSSDNENERPFHHPFQLKERPNNIVMNIRNCASLPVKTHQEKTTENAQQLRLQFPVSSGQQHRKTESEWIPVSSTKNEPKAIMPPQSATKFESFELPPLPREVERETRTVQPPFVPLPPPPPPPPPPVYVEPTILHANNYEIGNLISERLSEIRHQYETSSQPYQQINCWQAMENQAGLFTGSTGARVLSAAELASGQQAWAKKVSVMYKAHYWTTKRPENLLQASRNRLLRGVLHLYCVVA